MVPDPDWDARLRAAGLRSTVQRRAVLAAVTALGHASIDQIVAHVQPECPDVSLSTLYRVLEALDSAGLVTHTHLHHGSPTYHSVDGDPHIHLVCRECGTVWPIPVGVASGMAQMVRARSGFAVDLSHLALHGRCASCAGRAAPPGSGSDPAALGPS